MPKLDLSYNLSARLKDYLNKIESLRRDILLTPLSQKKQLQLRWNAMINRIYYSLMLSDNPLKKSEMIKLLTKTQKKLTKHEEEVIKYKQAIDYIKQNWLVSQAAVTPQTILTIYNLACSGRLKIQSTALKHLLDYLQAKPENPIILASIASIGIMNLAPFTNQNDRIARLAIGLFLYKHGYDFKELLVLEKYWAENLADFKENYQMASKASSITLWLEYFAKSVISSLEEVLKDISSDVPTTYLPDSFWLINDRQKSILSALEEPGANITNKKVQSLFKISQITAARDLAKLKILGLLNSYGKGRSVYYIKS